MENELFSCTVPSNASQDPPRARLGAQPNHLTLLRDLPCRSLGAERCLRCLREKTSVFVTTGVANATMLT